MCHGNPYRSRTQQAVAPMGQFCKKQHEGQNAFRKKNSGKIHKISAYLQRPIQKEKSHRHISFPEDKIGSIYTGDCLKRLTTILKQ